MGKWRNAEKPRWPLDNATLLPYLKKYVQPSMWAVELTGGEPSLYPEIDELLHWLSDNGYRTLVKTNGSGDLPHLPNVKLVAAFHRLEEPPKNFDEYLIVDKIQREEKEAYCKEHGIPYKVIGYNKENPDNARHGFVLCAFINPAGHQVGCLAARPNERVEGDTDMNRIDHRPLVAQACCPHCKAAIDAWRFL
jgi:organic radical activating enzyme